MNEWINIKDRMPPDKTWVEAVRCVPGTNHTWVQEWFYFSKYWYFDKSRVLYWRFITHSFFSPIANQSAALELPNNDKP